MVKQIINVGVTPNDRRGDPVRIAFQKSNDNFTELYTNVASLSDVAFSGSYNDLLNIPPGGTGGTSDRLVNGVNQLVLDTDGKLTFPTLSVDLHNGGIQSGQVLQFADPTKQAIISGPAPTGDNNAQRLIIQGHRATGTGEGGDVYLWAGDSDSNGGDIKIYAGDADAVPGNGGYINIDAGNGYANGGNVTITGGGSALNGGDVRISAGNASQGASGRVEISSAVGTWMFGADGSLTLPSGSPILFGNGNSRIQAGMGFHINSEEGISLEAVDVADPLNPISRGWYFGPNGNINLPSGSVISETASTISIAPPTAATGQSLVIRPTSALWSVDSSGFISYGNPITISVTLSSFPYFGTINYEITGSGVTEQSLGRPTTGKLTFAGIPSIDTQTVTWTIPANSDITEFTFTITSVDGTRSTDIQIENDPALYYNFEFNALPVGYSVTVTNDNITNLEFSHVHLVAGDPATVDLYLGDDDQFVKIEKNGGNVVVGTNANTKNWTFGTDGSLTFPGNMTVETTYGGSSTLIVNGNNNMVDIRSSSTILIGFNNSSGNVFIGNQNGGQVDIVSPKFRVFAEAPVNSTGKTGDQAGQVAFDNSYVYHCIADYNQLGHQVAIAADYLGRTSLNTNAFQFAKTADTLQITVGDIISDFDGGTTSAVVTVTSDDNYTYVTTGGLAYAAVFPLTFTSTNYIAGGNIWKRVAWSTDTW